MGKKRKLRFGVIGVGKLGRIHTRIYSELDLEGLIELAGVYDLDRRRATRVAREFNAKAYDDLQEMLLEVDAVSVVVPTSSHYDVAKMVISMGVHCLIEKPFTGSMKLAKRLFSMARKKNVILQVGHVERFNSAMQVLRQMVPSPPLFVECHRLCPFPNRATDVNVVMDLMIHDIDICLWFIPYKIKSVQAIGAPVLTDKDDIANARITFSNGSICDITASRISDETMRKIRMFFAGAYASIDYLHQEIELFIVKSRHIEKKKILPDKKEPLKEELLSFVNSCISLSPPQVSGEDGLLALSVAERINHSIARTKRRIFWREYVGKKGIIFGR